MAVPKQRCGYTPATPEKLQECFSNDTSEQRWKSGVGVDAAKLSGWEGFEDVEQIGEVTTEYCCYRPVWRKGRCLWHAQIDNKPRELFVDARGEYGGGERLDGAYLQGAILNQVHFFNCSFNGARITNAKLPHSDFIECDFAYAYINGVTAQNTSFSGSSFINIRNAGGSTFDNCRFVSADLSNARFSNVKISNSIMTGAEFIDTNLSFSEILSSSIGGADLTEASLSNSDLSESSFVNSDLINAGLEHTNLTRANLQGAVLKGAKLYGAVFADVQCNRQTDFGDVCYYEETDHDTTADDTPPLEKAISVYQALQNVSRENGLSNQARKYYHRRKNVERKRYWQAGGCKYLNWGLSRIAHLFTGYGDSPGRVIGTSIGVITVWTGLFLCVGGLTPSPNSLLQVLSFSIATFTTLSYSNLQPTTEEAQLLTSLEALLGTLLMALLVFVLGRRTTW